MQIQNDLDKVLKLISLKEKHGKNVVEAIDMTLEWFGLYGDDGSMQTPVSDNYMIITPVLARFPVSEAVLAIELESGEVKIDTHGLFIYSTSADQAADRMHEEQMERTLTNLNLAAKA